MSTMNIEYNLYFQVQTVNQTKGKQVISAPYLPLV